ncbi:MAG: transcription termination/antitermination protein NusG [Candidatus Poribacteria bacterium]|nr:transcription termination/antitermination protein NusG [Candidatus Poribacteria bacterium]
MPWYVIQTYSGHEKKVKAHLEQRIPVEKWESDILELRLPTQRIAEVKDGKRRTIERNVYPGYVFIKVSDELPEDKQKTLLPFLRQSPGVMGFVPSRTEPTPIRESEVPSLMEAEEVEVAEPTIHIEYDLGDSVRVIEGPFAGFTGQVNDVDMQKQKLKLTISIFGRATPVELEFLQVERI